MASVEFKTVQFPSADGLMITADLYAAQKPKGFILLCHRSHFNRGEYREAGPKLAALGFTCMAIDQRSGMNVLGVMNETSTLAKKKRLPTGYLDARPDIEAAVDYLYKKSHRQPVIVMGSSYSASLALLLAKDSDKIGAVIGFSPGEYLKGIPLAESIKGLVKPVYVTSAKKEATDVRKLMRYVGTQYKTQFKPKHEGAHGARVLWKATSGHEEYWHSLNRFLLRETS